MQAIGEVLSSSITGFVAEAWTDDESQAKAKGMLPTFGSFIKAHSEERKLSVFAVVYDIITGPVDQLHKPTALRMTRAQLKQEQPQIFSLLKTELHAAVIGYKQSGRCVSMLPPFPPEVHDFVYFPSQDELLDLSENLDFLRMLTLVPGVPADELMAATIRSAAKARHDEYDYLVEAGRHVSRLFRDDYDRLGYILAKIRP